jgi:zinc D-Ala-D-Ala carboxypeptidase
MPPVPLRLYNAAAIDALPAVLAHARRDAHARRLAAADWLLRRKEDGRFLATIERCPAGTTLRPLDPAVAGLQREISALLALLDYRAVGPLHRSRSATLRPIAARPSAAAAADDRRLHRQLAELGLDAAEYGERSGLPEVLEPTRLAFAGRDRYRRPLWLREAAARGWRAMQRAAAADGVVLDAISGFRSRAYQLGIFRRKRARGLTVEQILAVNAAPGFSEHHGGDALDLGTPGEPPAEEGFDGTAAFAWLQAHAGGFGFRMSYPRGNPHGIVYEPWHWCWTPPAVDGRT